MNPTKNTITMLPSLSLGCASKLSQAAAPDVAGVEKSYSKLSGKVGK
jgi:hypothetical protein